MAEEQSCADTGGCCGGSAPAEEYEYGPQPFVDGSVDTFAGPIRRVSGTLSRADRRGALRVRMNVGRDSYRVEPGLYALGAPDDLSPVIVTANYKLTFDRVRETLGGQNLWILVLDTKGINVWCAAGKGTFGTLELVKQVIGSQLEQIVSHTTLIVPQLGATGVAAEQVRQVTGFRVVWGPVDVADLPTFLATGNAATSESRRVRFALADRAVLIPVELSIAWRRDVLLGVLLYAVALVAAGAMGWSAIATALAISGVALVLGVVAGTVLTPLLLPWIPGRAFALKGALLGALLGLGLAVLWPGASVALGVAAVGLSTASASFTAMNFTGSSTYTSPSGVEWEMRRYIPIQVAGVAIWLMAGIAYAVVVA